MSLVLSGRKKIYTNYEEIDDTNIVKVLQDSYAIFVNNKVEIDYLFAYYKGIQPILNRVKKIRPEVNNVIVENHALDIVQFRTGYLLEKPIQYVARKEEVDNESLASLNDYLELENKEAKDKKIANHQAICGTALRLVLPNKRFSPLSVDESPFKISTVKPRSGYVVYSSDDTRNEEPMLNVIITTRTIDNTDHVLLQAYSTEMKWVFDITGSVIIERGANNYGYLPLIEYPLNEERIGIFEPVIPLLDAINKVQSNRVDGVEQFIQALLVLKNTSMDKKEFAELLELGAVQISDTGELKANVEYLTQELNQEQVQKLKDDMLNVVYKICGVPNNRGGNTDHTTGVSVIMHDGWSEAEARTQDVELMFKGSEREFLKVALHYTRTLTFEKNKLFLSDLAIKFTRRNYENTYQKAQTLDLMLKNGKVAPRLAFVYCGLFSDPEGAYNESVEYFQKHPAQPQPNPNPKEVTPNEETQTN